MTTIQRDKIQPGDTVRIRGDRTWLEVLEVHDDGLHVMNRASHHWFRWPLISKHKAAS